MNNNLLKGKRGIIFGALDNKSIAWKVALHAHSEGAKFVLTNAPIALRMGSIDQLAEETNSRVIAADATNMEDLNNLFAESVKELGGKIDFVLHSIGMSVNVRKGNQYYEQNYDYTMKGFDVSALSFHKVMQAAWDLDAMNEWGSIVGLSYIAAQRVFHTYNDMADNKAVLESIARSFGYHYGVRRNVRVNTISQSPTETTAGSGVKGFDIFYRFADDLAPLGNASADECAAYTISLFSDYTKKVTMQNLFHDGGFSYMGMSEETMSNYLNDSKK
ncbi:MAG: enoyl-ACP reductase [Flavobacteriales bacterium]|nr:enoyl-ACP reductase [Flavobacteriales bacterium]OUW96502.1 MAG: enoyl-ACP reductase [Flavobacteriales bacterium TMED228]|tara:strand:- start:27 stop:851 length:825 start_codon:yes stop_codon:yes gene_type:complete